MAKTQWFLLFATFFISCISLSIYIVSIGTTDWIIAKARNNLAKSDSIINYGLFSGTLVKNLLSTPANYELKVTCDYGENACIYSCQAAQEQRNDELHRILDRDVLIPCPIAKNINPLGTPNRRLLNRQSNSTKNPNDIRSKCISPGYWLSSLIFLLTSVIFSIFAAAMSLVNVLFNPVEPILSTFGIYVWNGISGGFCLLTIILWGALFEENLKHNVAITDTLDMGSELPFDSEGLASLGYSYWILFLPMFLCILNIALLISRQYLIEKEPEAPTITVDKNDFTIMLY